MSDASLLHTAQELLLDHSRSGRTVCFHGNSMRPFLRDGDELVIEPVEFDALRTGDIVTYRLEGKFPTRRVLYRDRTRLRLFADNWPFAKYDIWAEDVMGVVSARIRNGRRLEASQSVWKAATHAALFRKRARRGLHQRKERLLRALRGPGERAGDEPAGLHLNVSATCNLRCRMCPYLGVHGNEAYEKFMQPSTFASLLPVVERVSGIHFSGSGEPLFNQDLFDFIRRAREVNRRLSIDLTTNGTLLNRARARKVLEAGIDKLHISFDGANAETVQAIRRNVNAAKVIDNLKQFVRLRHEAGLQRPVMMLNVMMGFGTCEELVDVVHLAREIGAEEVQLLELQPASAEDYQTSLFSHLGRDGGRELKEAIKLADQHHIRLHLPMITENACHHPRIPHISESGEVSPCCFTDYLGRKLFSDGEVHDVPFVTFGNTTRDGFTEAWKSRSFARFREATGSGRFDATCRACYRARRPTTDRIRELLSM